MENQSSDIMVSVWCRTYNHVKYIRDALDGFVSQQTNFVYQVVVFDDASTDGTSDIVREYGAKYPDIIHVIVAEKNTYRRPDSREITMDIWNQYLTGKYIAFCEGDDFWIDKNKLQIQVDYMEAHPECSMYVHNALWLNCQSGLMKAGDPFAGCTDRNASAEELIMQYNGYPSTASFLFRGEQIRKPQFFYEISASDYATILYALSAGEVYYSSRIMSVYRVFADSSYAVRMQQDENLRFYFYFRMLIFLDKYDCYTKRKYHTWCEKRINCCVATILYGGNESISIEEQIRRGEECGYRFPDDCMAYADRLQKKQNNKWPFELDNFAARYEYIVIMGTGEFGVYTARMCARHRIEFNGFAVTAKKSGEDLFMGKEVYNLSELPHDRSKVGVVVGICPFSGKWTWDSILNSLESAGIFNWYCPFL